MLPPDPDPIPQSPVHPLVAVIDTCAFPHRNWLDRIRDAAQSDIWSDFVATGGQELPSTASQERISSALAADVASYRGIDVSEPFLNFLDELFDRSSSTPRLTESSVLGSPDDP